MDAVRRSRVREGMPGKSWVHAGDVGGGGYRDGCRWAQVGAGRGRPVAQGLREEAGGQSGNAMEG